MNEVPSPRAVCLSFPEPGFVEQTRRFGVPGESDGDLLLAFARRAVRSGPAQRVPGVLVVRSGPVPGVAVIGTFDDAALARVGELLDHLDEVLTSLHYVSYRRAERDVERLAELLSARFPGAELGSASFQAIPRGGHIVLGMLALAMELRPEQLLPAGRDEAPLVVIVDDCALSGHRVREAIERAASDRIALGVLYAPGELLRTIEDVDRRVVGCVAARPLRDRGPEWFGDGYAAWQHRWTASVGGDRYWVGRPEPVAFAWKEPDRSYLNRVTGEQEEGWKLMPPELCFAPSASPSPILQLQEQGPGAGPLRVTDEVFFAEIDDRIVIARSDAEDALELDEVGSAVFRSIHLHGSVEAAVRDLRGSYDVSEARLMSDAEALVDQLLAHGVLRWDHVGPPTGDGDARNEGGRPGGTAT